MAAFSGPEIVNSNLQFVVDINNSKSFETGNTWSNIIDNFTSTGSGSPSVFNNPSWLSASPIDKLTVLCVVQLLGTSNGYAFHPVSKWNNTSDATFVLYHFLEFTDNVRTYQLRWYANRGGVWGDVSHFFTGTPNGHYHVGLQYNSNTGGQLWINGSKIGQRRGSGQLANGNSNIRVDGGPQSRTNIHHTKEVAIYSDELSDFDILKHYYAIKGRYNV